MIGRLLKGSLYNQRRIAALTVLSIAMSASLTSIFITLSIGISGNVARELRSFGANITVEPKVEGLASLYSKQSRYLKEEDIKKIKTIFWRHNIVGIVPYLQKEVEITFKDNTHMVLLSGTWFHREIEMPSEENFIAGIKSVSPWWDVRGEWARDGSSDEIMLGCSIAKRLGVNVGDKVTISINKRQATFRITGIVSTGGIEDTQAFADLASVQALTGLRGSVSRILVSAITSPMTEFAYKSPEDMSPKEYDLWYCTAYVTSIARQIEEVITGSKAMPNWRVAQAEGNILKKIKFAVIILSAVILFSSSLVVTTTMIANLQRRTSEIGLMKALGADRVKIAILFLSEASLLGVIGALAGYAVSLGVVNTIGSRIFGTEQGNSIMLLFVISFISLMISWIGCIIPLKKALDLRTVAALKGV